MGITVLKFGGSSVANGKKLRHVAEIILRRKAAGEQVVAVLSAQGGTTDQLLAQAGALAEVPAPRELDALLATGEQVSCALGAILLNELGCPARSLTGQQAGICTDAQFGSARITHIDPAPLRAVLDEGAVAVVTGFQGVTDTGAVTTLGRGGSDTTAIALAGVLRAEQCCIYTDVDGVYTVDPRLYEGARRLKSIPVEPMLRLAQHGAKVLHDRCLETARAWQVDFEVRSTFTDRPGTRITLTGESEPATPSGIIGMAVRPGESSDRERRNAWKGFWEPGTEEKTVCPGEEDEGQKLLRLYVVWRPRGAKEATGATLAEELLRQLQRNGIRLQLLTTEETAAEFLLEEGQLHRALRLVHELYL